MGVVRGHSIGMVQNQNRIRLAVVGDTEQLGNARVDIPIMHPDRWKRAARSCRPPRTTLPNQRCAPNNHKSNRMAYEEVRPIRGATSLIRQSLLFEPPYANSWESGPRIYLKETPPPSYFILKSPPRTWL